MNVAIDKHDLFRNVIPGYVFLVVILSFYVFTNRLDSIKDTSKTIIALVAGFPLGFAIHIFYRLVFHFWSFFRYEQRKMEAEDLKLIENFSDKEELKRIESWFLKAYGEIEDENKKEKIRAKAFSHLFDCALCQSKVNESVRERIYFLMSFVHSLGASALAIFFGVIFVLFVKLPLWHPLWWYKLMHWRAYTFEGLPEIFLCLFWLLSVIVIYIGRKSVKEAVSAARKSAYFLGGSSVFIKIGGHDT